MDVDLTAPNPGFQALLDNPDSLIVVDANFFMPPDRTNLQAKHKYSFEEYRTMWIDPMRKRFPNMAIHEAVLQELVDPCSSQFAKTCIAGKPPSLRLLCDSSLTPTEEAIRTTKEQLIARYTNYDPFRDNKDDRGEVKSLAHMGTKGYTYFSTHDAKALRLIENAEILGTTLDELRVIHFYEGIYYLFKMGDMERDRARKLYRYLYFLTNREKRWNPGWDVFCAGMDKLYTLHGSERTDGQTG